MQEITTTENNGQRDLYQILEDTEVNLIRWSLVVSSGNVAKASRLLSINRTTLIFKLNKYKIKAKEFCNEL